MIVLLLFPRCCGRAGLEPEAAVSGLQDVASAGVPTGARLEEQVMMPGEGTVQTKQPFLIVDEVRCLEDTQSFNTTTPMGRLTLNIHLSGALSRLGTFGFDVSPSRRSGSRRCGCGGTGKMLTSLQANVTGITPI